MDEKIAKARQSDAMVALAASIPELRKEMADQFKALNVRLDQMMVPNASKTAAPGKPKTEPKLVPYEDEPDNGQ